MKASAAFYSKLIPVFCCAVIHVACRNLDSTVYTTGLDQFDLTAEDVFLLEPKALAGDRKAAQKLMFYYGHVKGDMEKFERWKKIAQP